MELTETMRRIIWKGYYATSKEEFLKLIDMLIDEAINTYGIDLNVYDFEESVNKVHTFSTLYNLKKMSLADMTKEAIRIRSTSVPVADKCYSDEVAALTEDDCINATIKVITEFINSTDTSGIAKDTFSDEFAKFIKSVETDSKVKSNTAIAFKKMLTKTDLMPKNSPEYILILFDFFVEIGIMNAQTSKIFKNIFITNQLKPVEQPVVAHDLNKQPKTGFDVGNFVQQPNPKEAPVGQIKQEAKPVEAPKQYEGMNFKEKVEYVQKRINFIPKTHPKVGESWFDALITLISDPFIQSTLTNLGAVKNPRFYEAKTYDSEHGKYDIAFNVNCTNDDNRIIVRYSTKLTQQANGTLGYSFDAKVVAKK